MRILSHSKPSWLWLDGWLALLVQAADSPETAPDKPNAIHIRNGFPKPEPKHAEPTQWSDVRLMNHIMTLQCSSYTFFRLPTLDYTILYLIIRINYYFFI